MSSRRQERSKTLTVRNAAGAGYSGLRFSHRRRLSLVDLHLGRVLRQTGELGHEHPGCRNVEVRSKRACVRPVFEEHESMWIFYIVMNGVQQAPRLRPRSSNVLQTEVERTLKLIGTNADTAGHDEHATNL